VTRVASSSKGKKPGKPLTCLGQLTGDPRNARKHTPRNVDAIVDAIHEVGAARSIVIDEDGVILAGNATVKAAGEAGLKRVRVIQAEGDELIAVQRSGLTAKQKTRLALFDNRASELADWDVDVLRGMEPDEITGMFTVEELSGLLGEEKIAKDLGEVGEMVFRIVITCQNEEEQLQLLERLENEGVECRALMS
jgi:ParB-like chromosome segregation protein Spo0J